MKTVNIFIFKKMNFKNIIFESLKEQLGDNFSRWFSGSKITKNGQPMICYHGSNLNNIQIFDLKKIGRNTNNYGHYGYGFYFSEDIREAKWYGNYIYKCYLNVKNPFFGTDFQMKQLKQEGVKGITDLIDHSIDFNSFKESFKNDNVAFKFLSTVEKKGLSHAWGEVFANKKKMEPHLQKLDLIGQIVEYTSLNKDVNGVPDYILNFLQQLKISPKINKEFPYEQALHWATDLGNDSKRVTDIIKKLGYDGVWYGSEIVCFYPNQIKSVNNDGSWDIDDENIFS